MGMMRRKYLHELQRLAYQGSIPPMSKQQIRDIQEKLAEDDIHLTEEEILEWTAKAMDEGSV